MSTGDKRYLGDVFINQENYERQKQFFRDIIDSYQYKYGGSFDASTLQGKVPEDFATREQGEKADRAILSPLLLGKTEIVNIDDSQYIYTDAVLLDRDDGRLDAINWYNNLDNDDVTDALVAIYNEVLAIQNLLQTKINKKLDTTTFNNFYNNEYTPFKNEVDEALSELFEEFTDEFGNVVKKLNAQLVNGLRFILITQDAYNALPSETKNYWRNIFIIRDPADIPPDYVDPMKWQLEDGYTFAVRDGKLQVTNGLSNTWKTICTLEELLSGSNFNEIIADFLANNSYIIPKDNMINSLYQISTSEVTSNWTLFPFLSSSLHDDFVKNITMNNSSSGVTSTVNETSKFKTVNLDIESAIVSSTKISSINQSISDLNSSLDQTNSNLGELQTQVNNIGSQIQNTITPKNNEQDQLISALRQELDEAKRTLSTVSGKTYSISTNMATWKMEWLGGLVCPVAYGNGGIDRINWMNTIEKGKKSAFALSDTYYVSNVQYNEALGLARIYVSFIHWHRGSQAKQWLEPRIDYKQGSTVTRKFWSTFNRDILGGRENIKIVPVYSPNTLLDLSKEKKVATTQKPFSNVIIPNIDHPVHRFIRIDPYDGKIWVYSDETTDKRIHFYGAATYSLQTGGLDNYEGQNDVELIEGQDNDVN